jgi:ferredoxin
MNTTLREMLRGMQVPDSLIRFESFSRPTPSNGAPQHVNGVVDGSAHGTVGDRERSNGTVGAPTLTFARSGKSADNPAAKTVLEVAEDLDVSIDFDCRAGICGTCKVKLLSGNCRLASGGLVLHRAGRRRPVDDCGRRRRHQGRRHETAV